MNERSSDHIRILSLDNLSSSGLFLDWQNGTYPSFCALRMLLFFPLSETPPPSGIFLPACSAAPTLRNQSFLWPALQAVSSRSSHTVALLTLVLGTRTAYAQRRCFPSLALCLFPFFPRLPLILVSLHWVPPPPPGQPGQHGLPHCHGPMFDPEAS